MNTFLKGFLPAPLSTSQEASYQTGNSLEEKSHFLPLYVRLAYDDKNLRDKHGEMAFDYCCPTVQDQLKSRTCTKCGIYHATVKSLNSHKSFCNMKNVHSTLNADVVALSSPRIRPIRVAARRQHEKMVVWKARLQGDHVDWFDVDDLDLEHVDLPPVDGVNPNCIPLINMDNYMEQVWEADNTNK